MTKPDKQDWEEWKNNPVTKWMYHKVMQARKETEEALGSGASLNSDSVERTALVTAGYVGFIDGMDELLKLEP